MTLKIILLANSVSTQAFASLAR